MVPHTGEGSVGAPLPSSTDREWLGWGFLFLQQTLSNMTNVLLLPSRKAVLPGKPSYAVSQQGCWVWEGMTKCEFLFTKTASLSSRERKGLHRD